MRRRSETRRLDILQVADTVFLAHGYAGASMSEIARRLGGSKQTLYNYFPSKEELFIAMMLDRSVRQADPLFARLTQDNDLRRALTRFGREFLAFVSSGDVLALRKIIVAEGGRSVLGQLYFEHGPKRGWTQVAAYFERAMDDGRLRRADPWTAAMHFQGLCEAGPFHRRLEGVVDILSAEEIAGTVDDAVEVFLRGYAPVSGDVVSAIPANVG